jgi:hypothetical protein
MHTGRVTSPPRLPPMLAGGSGIRPNPDAYQFEPKLDGSPHRRHLCQGHPGDPCLRTSRRG